MRVGRARWSATGPALLHGTSLAPQRGAVSPVGHPHEEGRDDMAVAKVIEITADSQSSFEDAVRHGVLKAADTVKNIKGAWVKDQEVVVKGGEVDTYRVHLKVTFLLAD
jgi:flavin-binding protein dodecin